MIEEQLTPGSHCGCAGPTFQGFCVVVSAQSNPWRQMVVSSVFKEKETEEPSLVTCHTAGARPRWGSNPGS